MMGWDLACSFVEDNMEELQEQAGDDGRVGISAELTASRATISAIESRSHRSALRAGVTVTVIEDPWDAYECRKCQSTTALRCYLFYVNGTPDALRIYVASMQNTTMLPPCP